MDPFLIIPDEGGRRQSLAGKPSWTIGRGGDNDIVIDNRWISRHHAVFQRLDSGAIYLIDLGSRNGSLINGQRVVAPVMLADGDRLMLGRVAVEFYYPVSPDAAPSQAEDALSRDTLVDSIAPGSFQERRMVSVGVVDIRDFTVLARTLDDRLLSDVIGAFHTRSEQVLRMYGSWGGRSTGDGQMAVWAHDEGLSGSGSFQMLDARGSESGVNKVAPFSDRQCVRVFSAILEIADLTNALHREFSLPNPLRIGAGVNTGLVMVGNISRGVQPDLTVLGDTVNAAFRLESATRQIGLDLAIGASTYERLYPTAGGSGTFQAQRAAEPPFTRHLVHLKGYDSPQFAYACSFSDLRSILKGPGS